MATTFGALVYEVLENLNLIQSTPSSTPAIHLDRARKAVIDAIAAYEAEPFGVSRELFVGIRPDADVFEINFATPNYDGFSHDFDSGTSQVSSPGTSYDFQKILEVFYQNSDTGDMHRVVEKPWIQVYDMLSDAAADIGSQFDYFAWRVGTMLLYPIADGSTPLYIRGLNRPARITREYNSGWIYKVDDVIQSDIDSYSGAVFDDLDRLYVLRATADLLQGPYADEKGIRQQQWRAREREEFFRLKSKRDLATSHRRVTPFI